MRVKHGPQRPAFQDKSKGIVRSTLPQTWVQPWFLQRVDAAIDKLTTSDVNPRMSRSAFIREAVGKRVDEILGPAPESTTRRRT